MEPVTTIGVGAIAAYLSKDGVGKILGPTADYLGGELKELTQKRIINLATIFKRAEDKLGDNLNKDGTVPPKILKVVINEGSYATDQVATDYFGGVLASSRTTEGRDDRGARIAKTIDNMSCYQLRAHYLIYSTIAAKCNVTDSVTNHKNRKECQIFIPAQDFFISMEFTQEELDNLQILSHIFEGLDSDGLIGTSWGFGGVENLKLYLNNPSIELPCDGIICEPTIAGFELFLWGFGFGKESLNHIFNKELDFSLPTPFEVMDNSICTGLKS